ncbi:MAG: SoxR reducing system RseC family protein [Bacteroidales bacterium]
MPQEETITHEGTVLRVPGDGTAEVEIITAEACSGCLAKSVCSPGKADTRIITVKNSAAIKAGDHVMVVMQVSQGFRALAIGYIIPFIVLIAVFVITTVTGAGEVVSAMLSFAAVGLYYLSIWLLRGIIGKKFEFKIKV